MMPACTPPWTMPYGCWCCSPMVSSPMHSSPVAFVKRRPIRVFQPPRLALIIERTAWSSGMAHGDRRRCGSQARGLWLTVLREQQWQRQEQDGLHDQERAHELVRGRAGAAEPRHDDVARDDTGEHARAAVDRDRVRVFA